GHLHAELGGDLFHQAPLHGAEAPPARVDPDPAALEEALVPLQAPPQLVQGLQEIDRLVEQDVHSVFAAFEAHGLPLSLCRLPSPRPATLVSSGMLVHPSAPSLPDPSLGQRSSPFLQSEV